MGNKNTTIYMVNNELELIYTNIALGNESYHLEEEHRELIEKIAEAEENIIDKIAKANNRRGFAMVMQSSKKERI